jgi:hypothetical protein
MSDRDRITRLLGTSGEDAGCEGTLALLAEYVEGELAGRDVDEVLPAVAAHLRNCPACAEDYQGLSVLAREQHRAWRHSSPSAASVCASSSRDTTSVSSSSRNPQRVQIARAFPPTTASRTVSRPSSRSLSAPPRTARPDNPHAPQRQPGPPARAGDDPRALDPVRPLPDSRPTHAADPSTSRRSAHGRGGEDRGEGLGRQPRHRPAPRRLQARLRRSRHLERLGVVNPHPPAAAWPVTGGSAGDSRRRRGRTPSTPRSHWSPSARARPPMPGRRGCSGSGPTRLGGSPSPAPGVRR